VTRLLDINVLMALFDPRHEFHESAHHWFGKTKRDGWASCPLTINGFIRILSHPGHPACLGSAAKTAAQLAEFAGATRHTFWPDAINLLDPKRFLLDRISSARHLTDVYLLGLAVHQKGVLSTFDQNIPKEAVIGGNVALELIP